MILNLQLRVLSIVALAVFSLVPLQVFAFQPVVVCGGDPASAAVELDYVTTHRGGTIQNQLVLRNADILRDFIARGAVYQGELNASGEFIVGGFAGASNGYQRPHSLHGSVNNRHIQFVPVGPNSYSLRITYTDNMYREVMLAEFTFNDCYTNRLR